MTDARRLTPEVGTFRVEMTFEEDIRLHSEAISAKRGEEQIVEFFKRFNALSNDEKRFSLLRILTQSDDKKTACLTLETLSSETFYRERQKSPFSVQKALLAYFYHAKRFQYANDFLSNINKWCRTYQLECLTSHETAENFEHLHRHTVKTLFVEDSKKVEEKDQESKTSGIGYFKNHAFQDPSVFFRILTTTPFVVTESKDSSEPHIENIIALLNFIKPINRIIGEPGFVEQLNRVHPTLREVFMTFLSEERNNTPDYSGKTPFDYALEHKNIDSILLLLQIGVKISNEKKLKKLLANEKNDPRDAEKVAECLKILSPFHYTDPRDIPKLKKCNRNINEPHFLTGQLPLSLAIDENDIEKVLELLKAGAAVNDIDSLFEFLEGQHQGDKRIYECLNIVHPLMSNQDLKETVGLYLKKLKIFYGILEQPFVNDRTKKQLCNKDKYPHLPSLKIGDFETLNQALKELHSFLIKQKYNIKDIYKSPAFFGENPLEIKAVLEPEKEKPTKKHWFCCR